MPIILPFETRRISQHDFGHMAYGVIQHVFDVHNQYGRLFNESIYKKELASRISGVALEVQVDVVYKSFVKSYFLDFLKNRSGLLLIFPSLKKTLRR